MSKFKRFIFNSKKETEEEPKEEALTLFRETKKPETLEEAMEKYPYLAEYIKENGLEPFYVVDPSALGTEADLMSAAYVLDIIYPLERGIFIHIKAGGEIGKYNIIEPEKPNREILDQIESAVAKLITERTIVAESIEEKERVIAKLFNEAIQKRKINLPEDKKIYYLYHFLRERIGHGFIDIFLADPWLEDISVPGAGHVYVYHKFFGSLESNIEIQKEEIDQILRSLAERYGHVLSYSHPIIDIHLPDGSRFNIVYGEDISLKGSNFTIRKFPKEPISVAHLIGWNTFSAEFAAYMWMLFEVGISAFICGETASGKTTTLNALTGLIRSDSKIVSIEETPEVNLAHRNWVREVTRLHSGSVVSMFDLLKAALRQRPDYIIVGEIRGEEGQVAFQAIETGHPVLSTFHAGDLQTLFQRLTSPPINVPKTHINGLNLAIFQNRIKRGLRLVRRVLSVNEIISYDSDSGSLNYFPVFVYDPDADQLRFRGSSIFLEAKVLPYRGWGTDKTPELYRELQMRAEILRVLSEKSPKFRSVWNTVIETEQVGVEKVYRMIKEGKMPWLTAY
ncbi:type II/IV secretion system ATPase subunit [Candidatus Bathyarchaeota archaeon]|nr:type II/IV secretion system ATPase subunit [Candidatus Bathyarchaeota archaeon]